MPSLVASSSMLQRPAAWLFNMRCHGASDLGVQYFNCFRFRVSFTFTSKTSGDSDDDDVSELDDSDDDDVDDAGSGVMTGRGCMAEARRQVQAGSD